MEMLTNTKHGLCWLMILALCIMNPAGSTFGQSPARSGKKEPEVLRVTTRLVQVNVVVQDKKGDLVPGLTRDDFTLEEGGKAQQISFFTVETNRVPTKRPLPLPPNVFSNRPEFGNPTPMSITVILLDGLNTRFEDQAYAKAQIVKFLKQLQPQDRVALYALGSQLRVLHDFTSEIEPLLRALNRYKGRIPTELEASQPSDGNTGIDDLDSWLPSAEQQMNEYHTINRVQRTLNALESISHHLARLPGRKNLIWVSGSFPFSMGFDSISTVDNATAERRTFSAEFERTARALNTSNLAIYPVDARGLVANLSTIPDASRSGPGVSYEPSPAPMNLRGSFDTKAHETMQILAERTGGLPFYNSNDLQGAIRRAIEDTRITYVLGYYPAHTNWDGKFHQIKVHVKRPGLQVRHRMGYFALPEPSREEKPREAVLQDAVWSPLDATSLPLTVRIDPAGGKGKELARVKVSLLIDPRGMTLTPEKDRWTGTLDFLFVQQNAEGQQVAGLKDTVDMQMPRERYDQISKSGLIVTKHLDIAAGAEQLRVLVRDTPSGALGSLHVPLSKITVKSGK